ncbi:hypothetical protein DLJ53_17000 [Acuticoccus sediminis]|uniref:Uncharacterized protein n=1 Tax=Acuticoccus sediminis TaxID=2184697 RepID=A0A8B2NUF4_9HYPH|nr:hypothetical protein [Acuticoccus sediminis]RAI00925.1 hypothetical protein DLJ53_17000 [Acuticoccus sediminis]
MKRVTACLVFAFGLAVTASTPAAADTAATWITPWRLATPRCADHPNAPVIGRIAGEVGFDSHKSVSFVGCFPSFEACYAWKGPLSGRFGGRIIINRCDPRFGDTGGFRRAF